MDYSFIMDNLDVACNNASLTYPGVCYLLINQHTNVIMLTVNYRTVPERHLLIKSALQDKALQSK